MQEVRADGAARDPSIQLPAGIAAVIGIAGGLLVASGDWVAAWNQTTHRIDLPLAGFMGANLIDVHTNRVAWGTNCRQDSTCAGLGVVDLTNGNRLDFHAPPNAGYIPTGGEGSRDAFSPGGRYLAIRVGPVTPTDNHPATSQLHVIDLAGNTETAVPGSATDYAFSRVAGAPTTPWVFFENSAHQLAGYFPATGVTTVLGDRCCGVALVTIRQ